VDRHCEQGGKQQQLFFHAGAFWVYAAI
jgi:hypothetical protein